MSIAIVEDGKPIAGVLQCPARNEVIEAGKGFGASQNGMPIQTRLPPLGEKFRSLPQSVWSMSCPKAGVIG